MAKPEVKTTDPRSAAEAFVNTALSVYFVDGHIHLTLGVERPEPGAETGTNFRIEREVVTRIVMPARVAMSVADTIKALLSPAGQASRRAN